MNDITERSQTHATFVVERSYPVALDAVRRALSVNDERDHASPRVPTLAVPRSPSYHGTNTRSSPTEVPMADVEPIPPGYPVVSPYLCIDGAAAAIEFYSTVFGATERVRMDGPGGKVGHAELEIGDSVIMLADEFPDMGGPSPKSLGGTPVTMSVYVHDVDRVYGKALEAGALALRPVENQFYGDRSGQFEDPFGHRWNVATHVEDVSGEEMARRAAEALGS